MVTRQQLVGGIADFIEQEVASAVSEVPLKIALFTFAHQVRTTSVADKLLATPAVGFLLPPPVDGSYDVESLGESLKKSMEACGGLTLTIPSIPLILKGERELTFHEADVDSLLSRINGVQP